MTALWPVFCVLYHALWEESKLHETYLKEMTRKIVGPRRNLLNVHNRESFGDFCPVMVTELTGGEKGVMEAET